MGISLISVSRIVCVQPSWCLHLQQEEFPQHGILLIQGRVELLSGDRSRISSLMKIFSLQSICSDK